MGEGSGKISKFVGSMLPNIAWDCIKAIGGIAVVKTIWTAIENEYYRSSTDWLVLAAWLICGLALIAAAYWLQERGRRKPESDPTAFDPYSKEKVGSFHEPKPQRQTPQEIMATALVLIADLCGFLKEHDKTVEPPPHDYRLTGLEDIPDDIPLRNNFPTRFVSRLSEMKTSLGTLGMLDIRFNFSNIASALGSPQVRNAADVREVIRYLEVAEKKIKDKYVGKESAQFASEPSYARSLKYTEDEINRMPLSKSEDLIRSNDKDYADACEYHCGGKKGIR